MSTYGYKPFWFWNGDMDEDEIKRQISLMAEQGIDGFFIHARQGLSVPYLSKEWFYKVSVAIEEAKKKDLEVWLYDEYPYPSGAAGGEVMLNNPDIVARELKIKIKEVRGPDTIEMDIGWGKLISAGAYRVLDGNVDFKKKIDLTEHIGIIRKEDIFQMSGLTAYNRKRYFAGDSSKKLIWRVPSGIYKIYIFTEEIIHDFKYYDTFIDPLNYDAITYFIQATHEKYKKYFGHEFGKTIKGIFSDEVGPIGTYPWSPELPRIFYKNCGYSLVEVLPVLFDGKGDYADKVRFDYWNTVVNVFIQSFDVQIHQWCQANSLLYAAEKPILRSNQLRHIDIPGIDTGHIKAGRRPTLASPDYRANAKLVSSAAHFYKKERTLCECFHSIGWGMTLQDMKWTYDWLAFQGINFFVPHAFYYTTDGLRKHDAPPSSFYQMPWWKHSKNLSDYTKNLCKLLSEGERKVNVLVVDPITSQWTAFAEKSRIKEKLKMDFSRLQNTLMDNFYEFYIIDPQLLSEGIVDNGSIMINGEKFTVIIFPPMTNLENKAMIKILEYAEKKGTLIVTGCLPIEKINDIEDLDEQFSLILDFDAKKIYDNYVYEKGDIPEMLCKDNIYFVKDVSGIDNILEKLVKRELLVVSDGYIAKDVKGLHMTYQNKDYYFVINTSDRHIIADIFILNKKAIDPIIYEIMIDGNEFEKLKLISISKTGEFIKFNIDIAPFESKLFALGEKSEEKVYRNDRSDLAVKVIDVNDLWNIQVKNKNALLMNKWNMYIEMVEGKRFVEGPFEVECMPIIDQLNSCNVKLPIYLYETFGRPKKLKLPSLEVNYLYKFEVWKKTTLFLVMEPGGISGEWKIYINGTMISPEDFRNMNFYLPTNMAVDITRYVDEGINEIVVKVKIQRAYEGLINPMYIFGDFGVFKSKGLFVLSDIKDKTAINDLKNCGLPFYAGDILYRREIEIKADEMVDMMFCINNVDFQDAATLYINGYCAGTKSWHPYRWKIKKEWLNVGRNTIELIVSNTLLGLFEGKIFDYRYNEYCNLFEDK